MSISGGGMTASSAPVTSCIYVSRHFEVRDHDEPVKYIFNGDTRVARVTGSLGTTLRIQRFRLHRGWNLLSVAVSATNGLHQVTNGHPSVLSSQGIFTWNQPTLTWVPLSPGQLPAGTVLWLHAATNAVLAMIGTYAEPTNRTVNTSGGFLPSAGLEVWDVRSAISNLPSAIAWTFDRSVPRWLSWLSSPLQSHPICPTSSPQGQPCSFTPLCPPR